MDNIHFRSDVADKVLSGEITLVAQCLQGPPLPLSSVVKCTTDSQQDAIAEINITGGFMWDPKKDSSIDIEQRIGYSLGEIALKLGYQTWEQFIDTYKSLNPNDDAKHYIAEFELVRNLRDHPQLEIILK